ncbi:cobalamin biosynthesis protein [Nocardia mexicana]
MQVPCRRGMQVPCRRGMQVPCRRGMQVPWLAADPCASQRLILAACWHISPSRGPWGRATGNAGYSGMEGGQGEGWGVVSGAGEEFVVGVGLRPSTGAAEIVAAVREVVGDNVVRCLATVERRAGAVGLIDAATELGVPIVSFGAAELAGVEVPNPDARTAAAVGAPSVAEAAALLAAGGDLVVPKRVRSGVTVAVARCPR